MVEGGSTPAPLLQRSSAVSRDRNGLPVTDLILQRGQLVPHEPECIATEQKMRGRVVRGDCGEHRACCLSGISQLLPALLLTGFADGVEDVVVISNRTGRSRHRATRPVGAERAWRD